MKPDTSEQWEGVGQQKDRLDNCLAAMGISLIPAEMHLANLRVVLADVSKNLRSLVVEATGDDPWDKFPRVRV